MNEQSIPTSEVLNRAADLIEERGWRQDGAWGSGDSPICLEGGVLAAMGLEWAGRDFDPVTFRACPAYVAVKQHLGDRCRNAVVNQSDADLWAWNDTVAQSASEVVEVLRATAVIEAAREEQDAAFATYALNLVSA